MKLVQINSLDLNVKMKDEITKYLRKNLTLSYLCLCLLCFSWIENTFKLFFVSIFINKRVFILIVSVFFFFFKVNYYLSQFTLILHDLVSESKQSNYLLLFIYTLLISSSFTIKLWYSTYSLA